MSSVNMQTADSSVAPIQLDPELERKARELFSRLGLSLNTAINLFLGQAVYEQAIPFRIDRYKDAVVYTKEEFYEKIEQGMKQVRAGYGVVKSMDELKALEDKIIRESGLSESELSRLEAEGENDG